MMAAQKGAEESDGGLGIAKSIHHVHQHRNDSQGKYTEHFCDDCLAESQTDPGPDKFMYAHKTLNKWKCICSGGFWHVETICDLTPHEFAAKRPRNDELDDKTMRWCTTSWKEGGKRENISKVRLRGVYTLRSESPACLKDNVEQDRLNRWAGANCAKQLS